MSELIRWISDQILPHEADVRAWLRRSSFRDVDPDDVIQEAYARISRTSDLSRIVSARAFFFTVTRNVALDQMRRARSSPIACVEDFDALIVVDDKPDPERATAGRETLRRVTELMDRLPQTVREVLLMRRVEGLSQKAVAQKLGLPESTVEKRTAKGLKMLSRALERREAQVIPFSDHAPARRRGGE